MKVFYLILALAGLTAIPAMATEVGIQFDQMKVGVKLTTTTAGFYQATYIEEYVGRKDGFHLTQTHKLLDDGSTKRLNQVGYDNQGRKVFSILNGNKNTYEPYSCHYVVGRCQHTYRYYNSLTKKFVTNVTRFENRLDGDTLFVGTYKSDGDKFEVPFKLGPYRLRLSSEYKNALGKPAGFRFVDLVQP
ncbi:MAG: hypothetical protein R3E68_19875 [Burkholderiaceae bacterium]